MRQLKNFNIFLRNYRSKWRGTTLAARAIGTQKSNLATAMPSALA